MSRSCLRVLLSLVMILILVDKNSVETLRNIIEGAENMKDIEYDYLDDFPQIIDLLLYLQSLKKILDFGHLHKQQIDNNFAYGLSIAFDNLQHVLIKKENNLKKELKTYIKALLRYITELLQYFESVVKQDKDEANVISRRVFSLFSNRSLGVKGVYDFRIKKKSPIFLIKSSYPRWEKYESKVKQIGLWKPNPTEADLCSAMLAENNFNKRVCKLSLNCYKILVNGTNFGYSLTHRLLWLIQAYRGRGCRIFSTREDNELIDIMCTKIFREANYIASNKFKLLDLLLEQMSLCPLAGYPDTLRRSWLEKMLQYQTPSGCFGSKSLVPSDSSKSSTRPWKKMYNATHPHSLESPCDWHITAVSAGALSGAIRYVLEENPLT